MPPSSGPNDTAPATGLSSTPGDYGFTAGARVGRHVILERVGGGGMGVVYSAYDPKLDRRVAIKLLRPDSTSSAGAQQRLLREAQALARLAHPNVVNVYDVGEFEGRVFVEMELVPGTTLADWLGAQPRDWRAILEVFLQAGRGLAAAHAMGIVHRDFKPDNVLVGDDGRVRVADFGIALLGADPADAPDEEETALLSDEARDANASAPPVVRSLARSGPRPGTPAYMAPEQRIAGKTDARSDQYSFCLALREALARAQPPAWLELAIARGLSASPGARFPSMHPLLRLLESEPHRRQRRLVAVGALLTVALAGGAAWAAARSHRQGQAHLCSGAEREVTGVWGDAQRGAVTAAFARTSLPYAGQAAAQVTETLDRYAHDWAAMHTDSCEATRVRGEQSDAVMDRRMQCLDQRLAEAKTLAEIFAKGDGRVVERAVQASQTLSPITDCSAARARVAASAGGAPGKADRAIVESLGRASALDIAGKYADAIRTAEEALAGARAAKEPALEAQALELMGRAANQQADGPRAEHLLFDAFVAAEQAGEYGVAAKAATESGFSIGYLQNRSDEAEKWFRLASVAIDRLGGDDHMTVERIYAKSAAAWSAGKFKESIEETRFALRLSEEKLPNDTLERAYCLTGLGVGLMSQGETDEARGFLEQALSLDEKTLGPDHPNVEMDLFNLGTLAKAEGRYGDARGLLERALAIGQRSEPDGPMVALSHGALAEALMRLGRFDDAREHLARALSIAEGSSGVEKSRIADLYAARGRLARLEKRYDDAGRDLARAIALGTAAFGKDNPDLSDSLIGLARVQLETGQGKRAVPILERVLVLLRDLDPTETAEPRLALAQALWLTGGDRARATELAHQARAFYERVPARGIEVREIEDWFAKNGGP